ncbi:MAG: hypothetical protein SW833_16105 [Cyanobacteriota bacterium]|nr:hypothetical protein [Cyanobacteriota bacterium]
MIEVGTLVRVLYPDYAAGKLGYIEGREEESGRWIVRVEQSLLYREDESFLLSLKESEFEEIEDHRL